MRIRNLLLASALAGAALMGASAASASTCIGTCGVLGANGDIVAPPGGTTYNYVTTSGGQTGAGQISGVGGTNGSEFISDAFSAAVGDDLKFNFAFATSDGTSSFPDYAFAELLTGTGDHFAYLFTARTTTSGNTSPGFGLPANDATLNPGTTPIIAGAPDWAPLGSYSGRCYGAGCGYTGWIGSTYTIATAGTYKIRFGVSNYGDSIWDTGLAFNGLKIGDVDIPNPGDPGSAVPEPATWAMMLIGFFGLGSMVRRGRRQSALSLA